MVRTCLRPEEDRIKTLSVFFTCVYHQLKECADFFLLLCTNYLSPFQDVLVIIFHKAMFKTNHIHAVPREKLAAGGGAELCCVVTAGARRLIPSILALVLSTASRHMLPITFSERTLAATHH